MFPDVSVVIPTYNRRSHLRRALGTVLGQQGVRVEVIVVDDGSDDGTAEDMRRCADVGVRLIRHEESLGVCAARNAGIALAQASWIAFLDHDDLWAPNKLAAQLEMAGRARPDGSRPEWVCCSSILVDEADRLIGWASPGPRDIDAARLLVDGIVPGGGSGIMARADALRAIGGFDETMVPDEDWDVWIKLGLRGPAPIVDRPLMAYRVWSSSVSGRLQDFDSSRRRLTTRYASEAQRLHVRTDEAASHAYSAYRFLHAKRYKEASRSYRILAELEGSRKAAMLGLSAQWGGPALHAHLLWRGRRRIPAAVRSEAEAWLANVENNGRCWLGNLQPLG